MSTKTPLTCSYTGASVKRISLLLSLPALALALAPDRPPLADEWGYRPADGAAVALNPPSLTWVHENGAGRYAVEWARQPDFSDAAGAANLPWTVYTHNRPFEPGR